MSCIESLSINYHWLYSDTFDPFTLVAIIIEAKFRIIIDENT